MDNGEGRFATVCMFLRVHIPTVGTVNAVGESSPLWMTFLSLAVLYGSALLSIAFAGKIYTSSLLLKGKKFSPKETSLDIPSDPNKEKHRFWPLRPFV